MAVNPDINFQNPQKVVRRHRRFKILASGEVIIKGFEVPTLPSFLLTPDQVMEKSSRDIILKTPTSIARSDQYPELISAVSRIELCD